MPDTFYELAHASGRELVHEVLFFASTYVLQADQVLNKSLASKEYRYNNQEGQSLL